MADISNLKLKVKEFIELEQKIETYEQKIEEIKQSSQITTIEEKLKELRKSRNKIEKDLKLTIEENNLINSSLKLGKTEIQYVLEEKPDSLNQNYIKKSLENFFIEKYSEKLGEERCIEKANEIFQYILDHREVKTKSILKRISLL
jgi:hypothetical protein